MSVALHPRVASKPPRLRLSGCLIAPSAHSGDSNGTGEGSKRLKGNYKLPTAALYTRFCLGRAQ